LSSHKRKNNVLNRKVAFIGGGHITEIVIKAVTTEAVLAAGSMIVSDPDQGRLDYLQKTFGVATARSNPEAVATADYVFVNVLPQVVDAVVEELRQERFPGNKVIISLAAGIPMDRYKALGEEVPVIRALPNPPSQIGMGIVAIAHNPKVTREQVEEVSGLFSAMGDYVFLSESQINAVTALSTPAIVYLFFQALVDAGVRSGIDSRTSTQIVSKTILGAMEVWKRRQASPQELLSEASTPGGISVECLFTLEKYRLRAALSEAIANGAAKAAAFSSTRTQK
jgi:pyrroline-5-carboxylate reductase